MRNLLFSYLIFSIVNGQVNRSKYTSNGFELILNTDSTFIFYNSLSPVKEIVVGNVYSKKDSVVLSTHHMNGESIVFMILFFKDSLEINSIYLQPEFLSEKIRIPKKLYLSEVYYDNGRIKSQYFWKNQNNRELSIISFNQNLQPQKIENYKNHQFHGEQVVFKKHNNVLPDTIRYFKNGVENKKFLVFSEYGKTEKVKVSKKPEAQPVFCKGHF